MEKHTWVLHPIEAPLSVFPEWGRYLQYISNKYQCGIQYVYLLVLTKTMACIQGAYHMKLENGSLSRHH